MLFFFISLYMMSSCADDDCLAPGHSDEGNSCPATLLLEVGGFSAAMSPQTKVVAGADDENLINDIWVFQFNAITGESLHEPVYIDRDNNLNANDILVNLAQNGEGEQSRICIVANTGDENWVYENRSNGQRLKDTRARVRFITKIFGRYLIENFPQEKDFIQSFLGSAQDAIELAVRYTFENLGGMKAVVLEAFQDTIDWLIRDNRIREAAYEKTAMGRQALASWNQESFCFLEWENGQIDHPVILIREFKKTFQKFYRFNNFFTFIEPACHTSTMRLDSSTTIWACS